jgi:GNAT superfamily N-acetyltransferase
MPIVHAITPVQLAEAATLFATYAASIADQAASLAHQGFDGELRALPGKYAHPGGRIYLVHPRADAADASGLGGTVHAGAVGCGAIRPLSLVDAAADATTVEIKRMFIIPAFRGRGLAGELLDAMLADARAIGYRRAVLDTSVSMHAAIGLYTSRGFVPCPPYNDDPDPDTRWFARAL